MSDEIMEKAEELKEAILNSDEYRKYELYRKDLLKDEEMFQKVKDFRARNFEFQITGESANSDVVDDFVSQFADVLSNQEVFAYMNAELMLCKKLQKMYQVLMKDIELDLDFL